MNERDQQQSEYSDHRAEAGAFGWIVECSPESQIAYEKEKEKQSQRQSSIPGPPGSPDRLGPDRSGGQHDSAERDSDLRRGSREAIEAHVAEPEIQHAGQPDEREGQQCGPR